MYLEKVNTINLLDEHAASNRVAVFALGGCVRLLEWRSRRVSLLARSSVYR
jgi:hypothetical protein